MTPEDDLSPCYASPMDVATYKLMGLDRAAPQAVNGHGRYDGLRLAGSEFDSGYAPCAEAIPADGVRAGRVESCKSWSSKSTYPDTLRDIRFYTTQGMAPQQQDVALMVFNDGAAYLGRNGPVRASHVLDSLFANGEIGPTLAVFVNPGRPDGVPMAPETQAERDAGDEQRSIEYDSLRPDYGQFLLEEVIPLGEEVMQCGTTRDPGQRLVAGMSSGGIAAFTCAWHHPDQFGRVLCHCGSFTNIKGGHNYQYLVRTTPRKPIRIFMQSGENDINGIFGHWPMANQMLAQSLSYAGYDVRFEFGVGGHTLAHGGALFADSLRWLNR